MSRKLGACHASTAPCFKEYVAPSHNHDVVDASRADVCVWRSFWPASAHSTPRARATRPAELPGDERAPLRPRGTTRRRGSQVGASLCRTTHREGACFVRVADGWPCTSTSAELVARLFDREHGTVFGAPAGFIVDEDGNLVADGSSTGPPPTTLFDSCGNPLRGRRHTPHIKQSQAAMSSHDTEIVPSRRGKKGATPRHRATSDADILPPYVWTQKRVVVARVWRHARWC